MQPLLVSSGVDANAGSIVVVYTGGSPVADSILSPYPRWGGGQTRTVPQRQWYMVLSQLRAAGLKVCRACEYDWIQAWYK